MWAVLSKGVGGLRLRALWLFEALSGWAQEGALGRGQGTVCLRNQVRVRRHHGLPSGCLHHIWCMAKTKKTERHGKRLFYTRSTSHSHIVLDMPPPWGGWTALSRTPMAFNDIYHASVWVCVYGVSFPSPHQTLGVNCYTRSGSGDKGSFLPPCPANVFTPNVPKVNLGTRSYILFLECRLATGAKSTQQTPPDINMHCG